jgi:Flp pilus assembly protein CpaB
VSFASLKDATTTSSRDMRVVRPASPRKSKMLNMVLVCLIAVLLIAGLARTAMQPKTVDSITVVAAGRDLPPGYKLGYRDLHYLTVPKSYFTPDMATAYTAVVGRTTNSFTAMGEPIASSGLLPKTFALADVLSPNQRAITIKIAPENMVDYAVRPGDRVDVIATTTADSGKKYTKTIAQDVLVLMSPPKQVILSDRLKASEQDKLTVAVNGADAEKLSQAVEVSKIHVVLRSAGNHAIAELPGADDRDLLPHEALRVTPPTLKMESDADTVSPPATTLPAPPVPTSQLPAPLAAPVQWVVDVFKGAIKETHEVGKK